MFVLVVWVIFPSLYFDTRHRGKVDDDIAVSSYQYLRRTKTAVGNHNKTLAQGFITADVVVIAVTDAAPHGNFTIVFRFSRTT